MNQGFTLIELLVVVLIIGILSAVALPQYNTAVERSRATEALTQMSALRSSLERYHSQHEAWPIANAFNKLDVDIPTNSACNSKYGGKNFCLSFTNTGVITATRTRNSHSYTLQTTITPDSNGTYSSVRTCAPAGTNDSEAQDFCNAIAGSKDAADNGF